jgi:hypothetical protein
MFALADLSNTAQKMIDASPKIVSRVIAGEEGYIHFFFPF